MATFILTLRSVARASRMAYGSRSSSSDISATSAVSSATSDPAAPIATPTSAAASAGASLMPSPTISTARGGRAAIERARASARAAARHGTRRAPTPPPPRAAVCRWSPVSMATHRIPCSRSSPIASRAVSRGRSASARAPCERRSRRRTPPCCRRPVPGELGRGGQRRCRALETARSLPIATADAIDLGFRAQPGNGSKPGRWRHPDSVSRAWATMARAIGCSERDSTAGRDSQEHRSADRSPNVITSVTRRVPLRQRSGLVERDHANTGQPLEVGAPLDEHAVARRRRQRGDNRHRRRDHERARTGNHQQHQRAIDPRRSVSLRQRAAEPAPRRTASTSTAACRRARTDRRRTAPARGWPAPSPPGE